MDLFRTTLRSSYTPDNVALVFLLVATHGPQTVNPPGTELRYCTVQGPRKQSDCMWAPGALGFRLLSWKKMRFVCFFSVSGSKYTKYLTNGGTHHVGVIFASLGSVATLPSLFFSVSHIVITALVSQDED